MNITIDKLQFMRDGQPVIYAGQSCFKLPEMFENGIDVIPTLQSCKSILDEVNEIAAKTGDGAWLLPVLRMFTQYHGKLGNYRTRDYRSITALSNWVLSDYGFLIDWECLADCRDQSLLEMQSHCDKVAEALQGIPAFYSLGNEWQGNYWNPNDFKKPSGVISSRGSSFGDYCPPCPPWDYTKFHTRRDGLKGMTANQDLAWLNYDALGWSGCIKKFNQPCISDEPIGAGDADIVGRRSSHPSVFYRLAADSAKWGSGGTFHSDNGLDAKPYSETQRACGLAFMMGLAKVDPVQSFNGSF